MTSAITISVTTMMCRKIQSNIKVMTTKLGGLIDPVKNSRTEMIGGTRRIDMSPGKAAEAETEAEVLIGKLNNRRFVSLRSTLESHDNLSFLNIQASQPQQKFF